jgi:hypothetical protein
MKRAYKTCVKVHVIKEISSQSLNNQAPSVFSF